MTDKINPWKDLVSDREKEMAGIRRDLPDVEGWWFKIARLSPWNAKYYQAQARLSVADKYRDTYQRCVVDDEEASDADELLLHEMEVRAFIEGCVRDARFERRDGSGIEELTPAEKLEATLELFLAMPTLYHWARSEASKASNYQGPPVPDEAEVAKNSDAASGSKPGTGAGERKPS